MIDKYRKQKPDSLEDYGYEDEDGEFYFKDILLADDGTPETVYMKELFWEQLGIALEELPENQRQVFVWNELEDQTFQEIADRTGENIKTLISRKRYAVRHLRERLEACVSGICKLAVNLSIMNHPHRYKMRFAMPVLRY
ncbi:sigma factor-like helix-turn-helix DNA-binding protein [Paucibacter sp. O1-1]|nr:hypothetical protein [Paucibacter sp. O1-1]MDA3831676.1 sigma factor-like helix-turn-helix DNA-binding protein [Paucibacter sp. O1-1]